jgi:hypothetical protein
MVRWCETLHGFSSFWYYIGTKTANNTTLKCTYRIRTKVKSYFRQGGRAEWAPPVAARIQVNPRQNRGELNQTGHESATARQDQVGRGGAGRGSVALWGKALV